MIPLRDDVEVLAGVTGILLEPRQPSELAERFLTYVAGVFGADAGLFYLPGDEGAQLSAIGLDPEEAAGLADEFFVRLQRVASSGGIRERRRMRRWRHTLAAVVGIEPEWRGLLALFSTRAGVYPRERDIRLLHNMARHATSAIARARLVLRSRVDAERNALRAEEIERIRNALEHHSREVESMLAARTRYFAQMSHELRTPLNAILGYSGLLQEGVLGELSPHQADAVAKVASSARQLLSLVDDLLSLSRLEAGRLAVERSEVDLAALVAEAVAMVEVEARRKGLELKVRQDDRLPPLWSDNARIRQILLNLLSNAIKFTESGSISLEIRHIAADKMIDTGPKPNCVPGPNGWIGIAVEDTGPGIPRSHLESIFDEYVQVGESSSGTGLGLAISRRLARLLGGDLVADSEVDVRSTFMLWLPCPAPEAELRSGAAARIITPGLEAPLIT